MHISRIIFHNRAPFGHLDISLNGKGANILSAVNGRGKTTILTHLVDSFHEMARAHYPQEYEGKEGKLYRVSSAIHSLDMGAASIVYIRFIDNNNTIDYIDSRGIVDEETYKEIIKMENAMPFSRLIDRNKQGFVRIISIDSKEIISGVFNNNLMTYFPSYRHEQPGYLTNPYKIDLRFTKKARYAGYLPNPIEVVSCLDDIANWIMDIILDGQYVSQFGNSMNVEMNKILSLTLSAKRLGPVRYGVGPRGFGGTRIQVVKTIDQSSVLPTIFNLSSGESSILTMFTEILRQGDRLNNNIKTDAITGIVLIDEIEKHLHISLQKDVLPSLIALFPNVQFVISTHSPFFCIGMENAGVIQNKLFDLDNMGIETKIHNGEVYIEAYNAILSENDRFKEKYEWLMAATKSGTNPLIVTEGKTDVCHLKKAMSKLAIPTDQFELHQANESLGHGNLMILLQQLSKIPQARRVIGVFDRDVEDVVKKIEYDGKEFMGFGNNVFAICIPTPPHRMGYKYISIEMYYADRDLKKKCPNGKCLYFSNEVEYRKSAIKGNNKPRIAILPGPKMDEEYLKSIIDEDIGDIKEMHSKTRYAELVESESEFTNEFDFSPFQMIFDRISKVIDMT